VNRDDKDDYMWHLDIQSINEVKQLIEANIDLTKPVDTRGNTILHSILKK